LVYAQDSTARGVEKGERVGCGCGCGCGGEGKKRKEGGARSERRDSRESREWRRRK
jgi:hypothetical protein